MKYDLATTMWRMPTLHRTLIGDNAKGMKFKPWILLRICLGCMNMVTTYKNADEGTFYESPILQTRAELSLDSWDLDMMGESGTFLWCQFRRPVRCHFDL